MAVSEAQRRAKARYDRTTTQYVFRFRNEADAGIIEKLESVPVKTAYIRQLIKEDIDADNK